MAENKTHRLMSGRGGGGGTRSGYKIINERIPCGPNCERVWKPLTTYGASFEDDDDDERINSGVIPRTTSNNRGADSGIFSSGASPLKKRCDCLEFENLARCRRIYQLQRIWVYVLTFLCYLSFHAVRKPPSVVKNVWHRNCTQLTTTTTNNAAPISSSSPSTNSTDNADDDACSSWAPFDKEYDYAALFGFLDNAYLFAYAVGMFVSGPVVERLNLRNCLGFGMIASGVLSLMLGLAFYWQIHSLAYFVVFMAISGLINASGWPPIAAILGSWFPRDKRGFLFGLWNSCTSAGNIVGTALAARYVNLDWGMSFIAPAILIFAVALLVFLTFTYVPTEAPQTDEDRKDDRKDHKREKMRASFRARSEATLVEEDDQRDDENTPLLALNGGKQQQPQQQTSQMPQKQQPTPNHRSSSAIGVCEALRLPGVLPYSLSLFFIKLVSYTFLFWLPIYIQHATNIGAAASANHSIFYDVGGAIGAVLVGIIADKSGADRSPLVCVLVLATASPAMFLYQTLCEHQLASVVVSGVILFFIGAVINGPYSLISTAVAVDLASGSKSASGPSGADKEEEDDDVDKKRALSTVSSIVEGSGSVGAAIGPLLTGVLVSAFDWSAVFHMLIASNLMAVVPLSYMIVKKRKMARETKSAAPTGGWEEI